MQLGRYVKFREEQFGGVLFETQSEKVYTLNGPAASIVRALRDGQDAAGISATLKQRFADPSGVIERDVANLLSDLGQKGLLA
jgi:hypothetical protein